MTGQELGTLASGDPSRVLNFKANPNTDLLCIEVLDSVIRSHAPFFLKHQSLLSILHAYFSPPFALEPDILSLNPTSFRRLDRH